MDLLRTPWFALTWGGPTEVGSPQGFEDEDPASGVVASRSTQKTNATNLYLSGDGYERWGEDRICQAREAAQTTTYGRAFMRLMRQNVVGTGRTRIRVDHAYTQKAWDRFWMKPCLRGWSGEETANVVLNNLMTDGDFFAQWAQATDGMWGIFPRDSLLINDRNSTGYIGSWYSSFDGPLAGDSPRIIEGIELERATYAPIAYHLDLSRGDERVPASEMIHIFDRRWVNQVRGRPVIWQGIKALQDVDNLRGYVADDVKKRSRLAWIFKVKRSLQNHLERIWRRNHPLIEADNQKLLDDYMDQAINLEPGANLVLDEEVDVNSSQSMGGIAGSDYDITRKHFIGDAGASMGLQYATMAGDNSDGNFASQRLGRLQDIGFFETYQGLIKTFLEMLYVGWIMRASELDPGLRLDAVFRVMQPGWESIDPTKTAIANKNNLAEALTTRTLITASERGMDWETEVYPQWKKEREMIVAAVLTAGGDGAAPQPASITDRNVTYPHSSRRREYAQSKV